MQQSLLYSETLKSSFSEEEALEVFKKDREFYCPNAKRKNFMVKKIDDNIYDIRFDFKETAPSTIGLSWSISTYRIEFLKNELTPYRFLGSPKDLKS